ncbi:hypothetical protein Moror_7250 [Moniliophthora roreri MCA 2997]|uniref:F-box domain-containing protein n=2 Tax=Moniliophthora roreri TaxID=221103 RepID=V2XUQ0_MONRO|nr:hypothetical protein Moror_7250 [Moniliophthora roreri MCA 2997]KAI3622023.1 hypothetical protein WG66_015937 [Moniliophthora roreri]
MLPFELVIQVLTCFDPRDDKDTLYKCAIAHSSWTPVAQSMLFHELTLQAVSPHHENHILLSEQSVRSLETLSHCLEVRPHLLDYIQDLRIKNLEQNLRDGARHQWNQENDVIARVLRKLTNVKSLSIFRLGYAAVSESMRESIRHIFQLPSLTSLKVTWTIFPSFTQFLSMFSTPRNLTHVHLWSVRFTELRQINENTGAISTAPKSIRIQDLHLHLVLLKPFVAWFEMPQCPIDLSGMKTLRLHRSSMYDPESTATLLKSAGDSLVNLELEGPYRATESEQVHLGHTPNIQTLALINLQQTQTYDPIQWILSLFKPVTRSLLRSVRFELYIELPSHKFWACWKPVDVLFASSGFECLEEVLLVVSSPEEPIEPKSKIEEGFPRLMEKGVMRVKTVHREKELSRAVMVLT